MDAKESLFLRCFLAFHRRHIQCDIRPLRENFKNLWKLKPFYFLEKRKHIAALMAPKTVPYLFFLAYHKRGRFFLMKRA
ncbi:MAG: hypothetical protein UW24_C0012G0029 [Parcubacteria group bacterium GW2011_GWA2_44_12]|nr:MAG: hypothetical protein UW24_C0012G0029 [Parcubacteria group bacterium GW2011_GWA2_44_12]